MTGILETSLLYVASGLSVIPIKPGGSKSPAINEWKTFQNRKPTEDELKIWFSKYKGCGIAIVTGAVSGSLEIFDCDAPELFEAWCELVESSCPGLLIRLVIVLTPSGGYHVYYRSREIEGNQKLAQRLIEVPEGTEGGRWIDGRYVKLVTLLETRGEGGYVLAPGSPPECHPTGKPYLLIAGDLCSIPIITPHERAVLLDVARSFNRYIRPERVYQQGSMRRQINHSNRPGDQFNAKSDWHSLLTSHGWKFICQRGEISYWRRPGKVAPSISATTNYEGSNLLYVFSSNAYPFQENAAYSLFSAYSLLDHNGDFRAAAKALSEQGFGSQSNIILLSHLESISKPKDTVTLTPVERPKDTVKLSTPMRPATTTLLSPEVGR